MLQFARKTLGFQVFADEQISNFSDRNWSLVCGKKGLIIKFVQKWGVF